MFRMLMTASLAFLSTIVLALPLVQIEKVPAGSSCAAGGGSGCSIARNAEEDLRTIETVASACAQAAVSSIRTVVCLGKTSVEVYRILSGPASSGRS